MSQTITLSAENYDSFMKCLSNMKEVCTDLDLRQGVIRQRSTDNTVLFEMDVKEVIGEINLPLSDLKSKFDLLKIFSGHEVELEIEENYFMFSDEFSSIKFMSQHGQALDFMENKFITEDELNNIIEISEDELILDHELDSILTERIKIVAQSFNTTSVQVVFSGETASIKSSTQAKDQFATFVKNIITNEVINDKFYNVAIIPFVVEHDDKIKFHVYKDSEHTLISKFSTNLGDIDITMYSRSEVISTNDEEDDSPF